MKAPKDNRIRPIFITMNNKRTLAIADGKGNAYLPVSDDFYEAISEEPKKENLVNPKDYEFDRALLNMDF